MAHRSPLYSPEYGARPLQRVVQRELETPIARGLISGDYVPGDVIGVDVDQDAIALRIFIKERKGPEAEADLAEGTAA